MAVRNEAARVKIGQSIDDYIRDINTCFNQLEGIKTQVSDLITGIPGNADLNPSDAPDLQSVLDHMDTRISALQAL